MRSTREVIEAARAGRRLTAAEKRHLGEQLAAWWVERCSRCRKTASVDHLDARGGRCEDCVEAVERMGE